MKFDFSQIYKNDETFCLLGYPKMRHSINHLGIVTQFDPKTGIFTIHGDPLKLYIQPIKNEI